MSEAEVIPIGSHGRPGRGAGRKTTPSAAARALAPSPRVKKARRAAAPPAHPDPIRTESRKTRPPDEPVVDDNRTGARTAPQPDSQPDSLPAPGFDIAGALSGAAQEVFGEAWETRLAEFLAFCRRRLTGDYEIDDYGFDSEFADRFILTALRPLAQKWFRVEVRGIENIPSAGGALVVANHSGTVPVDALVSGLVVHDHADRHLRMLGADLVFRMPFVGLLARKGGATLASNEDAERMLAQGELVGVWPEGFKGIGKPFSERYKLQRFGRGGFVSAALRTGVPIVPCSIVGAEEIYPLIGNVPALARLLGVPYVPITPLFPWLGILGMVPLPSKWLIEFGEPIRTDSYALGAADDPMLVFNLTDQVRETIQQTLYTLLMKRRGVFF
jgi:1-acyl-sn-glycerol-3-phosphate acyltransferase